MLTESNKLYDVELTGNDFIEIAMRNPTLTRLTFSRKICPPKLIADFSAGPLSGQSLETLFVDHSGDSPMDNVRGRPVTSLQRNAEPVAGEAKRSSEIIENSSVHIAGFIL